MIFPVNGNTSFSGVRQFIGTRTLEDATMVAKESNRALKFYVNNFLELVIHFSHGKNELIRRRTGINNKDFYRTTTNDNLNIY